MRFKKGTPGWILYVLILSKLVQQIGTVCFVSSKKFV